MEVAVLGPVEVRLGGPAVDLGTPKQRALVTALALSAGRPVSVDTIVDLLWGDRPPPGVTSTLQAYVSGLRRVLEPRRERRAPATVLVTVGQGYALRLPSEAVDVTRFERTIDEQHRRLAGLPSRSLGREELEAAASCLDRALTLWRGTPYAELQDAPTAVAERVRLEELRLVAMEDRSVAHLALGRHATVAAELETLTARYPLRERLWGLRALALTRSGRQADALAALREIRRVLDEELGLELSAELRELEGAVLRQDASLTWVDPPLKPSRVAAGSSPVARAEVIEPPPMAESPVPWAMVGRDAELAALRRSLGRAMSGLTSYAVLTGEPGIGKSRLCSELTAAAEQGGVRVLVGRGLQETGAPPLWPWSTILEGLDAELPQGGDGDGSEEGNQFRAWEQIVRTVRTAAAERPLLLVLDDMHWMDPSSLRVLRLLAETSDKDRLLVLCTWRSHPEPSGALADVAETLARRHARRLELTGLSVDEVSKVFDTVAQARPTAEQAEALQDRTDGNPFFVVEFARLAMERGDLERLLEHNPPTAVQEVLTRRLDRLPDETVRLLRTAAVMGCDFDGAVLAGATGIDEDDLLDVIEPAESAGLVREEGVDRFGFVHALVRDTLYSGMSLSRRARAHARVAAVLQALPGHETELALHWREAGPAFAAQAWSACVEAAEVARRLHAHEQRAELLLAALDCLPHVPDAVPSTRFETLMQVADAYRWSGMWTDMLRSVDEAVDVAEAMGDHQRVARAAITTAQGALWQTARHGDVNEPVIRALRRSLDRLPAKDSALRCRCMLALASNLYYASSFREREALVEQALAMAHRLADDALLLDGLQMACQTLWRSATAPQRRAQAREAAALARKLGNESAEVMAMILETIALGELGRPDEMFPVLHQARAAAERLRLIYGTLVLDTVELPWLAMKGRFEECHHLVDRINSLARQISLPQSAEAAVGALIALALWDGSVAALAPRLEELAEGPLPNEPVALAYLCRGGHLEQARAYYEAHRPLNLDHDDWFSMIAWCGAAESAAYLEEPSLGADAYALLTPFAGRCCTAGSGNACGPVDIFLALAAHSVGETWLARRHADEAVRLCGEWQIPLAAAWVRDQRDRFGF